MRTVSQQRSTRFVVPALIASGLVLLVLGSAALNGAEKSPVGQDRDALLTPQQWAENDAAIDRGLAWLAQVQEPNGCWDRITSGGLSTRPALTSLAIMGFLARGHVPGQGVYGEGINNAIDFVLSMQRRDGTIGSGHNTMYIHGISLLMLAEVWGMCDEHRNRRVGKAIRRAVKLSLHAQEQMRPHRIYRGGWDYFPDGRLGRADLSITSWVVMSLRASKNAGFDVPVTAIDEALQFVKNCHDDSGGFRYKTTLQYPPSVSMSGAGIVTMELCGRHHTPQALAAGEWLLREPIVTVDGPAEEHFWYAAFYSSQAAYQLGGKYWRVYYPRIRKQVLVAQQPDGSFREDMTRIQGSPRVPGPTYSTSMAVLTLAVPYQLLPIYQR